MSGREDAIYDRLDSMASSLEEECEIVADVGDDVKASHAVGLLVLPDPSETVFLISDSWRP